MPKLILQLLAEDQAVMSGPSLASLLFHIFWDASRSEMRSSFADDDTNWGMLARNLSYLVSRVLKIEVGNMLSTCL